MPDFTLVVVDPIVGEIDFTQLEDAIEYAKSVGAKEIYSDTWKWGERINRLPINCSY